MPWNGMGQYVPPVPPTFPAIPLTTILSARYNALGNDVAAGISNCIAKDGQSTILANIPMSGFKFTGLAAGTGAGDSIRFEQLAGFAPLASPAFTGVPTVPTAASGANTTQAASTAFVQQALVTPVVGVIQSLFTFDNLPSVDISSIIPFDNTPPQNTEGFALINRAITPFYAGSNIKIRVEAQCLKTTTGAVCLAIFEGSGANALYANWETITGGETAVRFLTAFTPAQTTNPRTYFVRIGVDGGSVKVNANSAGEVAVFLTVEEIKV